MPRQRMPPTLEVGTPEGTAFMFAVLDVGNGAGIFAKHDLTVEKLNFAGGGKIGEAIAAGAVDLTVSGNTDMAFIGERRAGKSRRADDRGARSRCRSLSACDGEIAKPADLKGKTIGVTSPTSLTSWLALAFCARSRLGTRTASNAPISAR